MGILQHALLPLFIASSAFGLAVPAPEAAPKLVARKDWESPAYTWLYQYPLPIPPVKTPAM
jgi:hypothetical protein